MIMNKEAKHSLVFLTVLVIAFIFVDWTFGKIAYKFLLDMPSASNELGKTKFQVIEAEYDCYILGSSRAVHHYNPAILKDSLGLSVYNAGCDGQGISYADAILKAIYSRKKPKLVVLECSDTELLPTWLEKMSVLKPYYPQYSQMQDVAVMIGGDKEAFKCKFASYRLNSIPFRILKTYMTPKDKLNGFEPITINKEANLQYAEKNNESFSVDTTTMKVLNDLVKTCKDNEIQLIACFSPTLIPKHSNAIYLKLLFANMGVSYLDYSNDERFIKYPDMFSDYVHLREEGANIYTKLIAKDIKNITAIQQISHHKFN